MIKILNFFIGSKLLFISILVSITRSNTSNLYKGGLQELHRRLNRWCLGNLYS